MDGLTLISESDWKFFCDEWSGQESKGIHAEISFSNFTKKMTGSCNEMPIDDKEEHDDIKEETIEVVEERIPFIITNPEVTKLQTSFMVFSIL